MGDLRECRQLASQVTANGAKLYELLGKEVVLRVRSRSLIRSVCCVSPYHLYTPPTNPTMAAVYSCEQEQRKAALSKSVDIELLENGVKGSIAVVHVRHRHSLLSH